MNPTPKTLQIFLPEGTPAGIQVAELTTRIIQAVSVPKTRLQDFIERDKEVNHVGTYFLFGEKDDSTKPVTYIGQTEDLRQRLKQHDANKEFWTTAVILISRTHSFTQAHIRWLEWYSIKKTLEANRYRLENGNGGSEPHVTEAIRADLDEIFDTGKLLLESLGYPIFEPLVKRKESGEIQEAELWYCKGPNADAVGMPSEKGFVVLKGSKFRKVFTASAAETTFAKRRERELAEGVFEDLGDYLELKEDVAYGSPSMAAAAVLARHANGWLSWVDASGRTLDGAKRKV
ncbi:MAG: GIY-YIG nuclease family protein [Lentisphaerae bacterium]|nr:GIY-YIG nuclease family protein [Opitutales bacterium]NLX27004.1 GIY-YIG nuclease family protein [Lentisphaerota bacterium]